MADVPKRKVSAVVCNGKMVDVFDAMCLLERRKPHELVHAAVLEYLQAHEHDADVVALIATRRRQEAELVAEAVGRDAAYPPLRLVGGQP